MLLDIDTMIVQNIDHLFERDTMMLYTEDIPMDVGHHNVVPAMQGGFFLITPGPQADEAYDIYPTLPEYVSSLRVDMLRLHCPSSHTNGPLT